MKKLLHWNSFHDNLRSVTNKIKLSRSASLIFFIYYLAHSPLLAQPNAPTVSFEGLSHNVNQVLLGTSLLPPSPTGEAGPDHYVQAVNLALQVYDKAGNTIGAPILLGNLFAPLGAPYNGNFGSPVVLYDQLADRWLISQYCTIANPNSHQLVAISKTGDPTGDYYLYNFTLPNNFLNDVPKFGMWPDGYYMSCDQYALPGTPYLGTGVYAFDRKKMLAGDTTAGFIYFNVGAIDMSLRGMLPSDLDGFTPPPAGAPNTFACFNANEYGAPADVLRLYDFHADFTVPANSTFTQRTGSPLPVLPFNPVTIAGRDDIPQPAPATPGNNFLDANEDHMMFRLAYRNFGSSESLIANHTVDADPSGAYRAGVRYYHLSRTSPAAAFTIAEQETWAPIDITNRWMASGAMNHQGDLAVGYSASGFITFPSIRYAARLGTDIPGTGLVQGEQTIIAGGGVQLSSTSRWGEYSHMSVDPSDDCSFWYTAEYYPVTSEFGNTTFPWHTRIAKFSPGTCSVSPRGTISGTITSCGTGLPLENVLIELSGGISRTTDTNGTFNAILAPGTYAITIYAANTSPITDTVTITDGSNIVFDTCMTGIPNLIADSANITSDDCNHLGSIDPNELLTISLGIANTGLASTTNLVATLLATGGVTNPSGPQNYGVVVASGSTVFNSFTFTSADFACGEPFIITLQLQDGSTNLGTISYPLTTGQPSATPFSYSSGNIAVAIPDNGSVDIPITITDVMAISDIDIKFRINHTFDGDLEIKLIHPDNSSVILVNQRGGSGDNFGTGSLDCSGTPTVIDDQASTAIAAGVAPFSGSFIPESPLSAFNGKLSNGTWILRVSDKAAFDVGTVGCFQVVLKSFICCQSPIIAGSVAVIGENCPPGNDAIDPGETVTVSFCAQNIGNLNTTNLVGTLQATGGVLNPGGPQNYGVLVGGGVPVCRNFTFTADGTCGSTITASIQFQDGATDLGVITYTFTLGAAATATTTFTNATSILVPGSGTTSGPSSPYPSTINVAGLTGTVGKVTVTIQNYNHTFPDDVDMLLVGPTGEKVVLMSDVGGSGDAVNLTLTFDDAAANLIPDAGPVVSGTFTSSNIGTGDVFAAPAPASPYGNLLSAFNGLNPNGNWSLYVVDDAGGDIGNINSGWSLSITTSNSVCCTLPPCGPYVNISPAGPVSICSTDSVTLTAGCKNYTLGGIMDGFQEVPPVVSPAFGNFSGTFNAATNELTININFFGFATPTLAAHIHNAAPGVIGPIIVDLFPEFPINVTNGNFTKTVTLSSAHANALLTGNTYINIHTVQYPGGEIRGQIIPASTCPAISYSWSNGETTPSITVNTSDTYTVIATNAYGCVDSAAVTVNVDSPAIVDAGPDQTVCAVDTIYLHASLSGSATGGAWQVNNLYGTFIGANTDTNARFVLNGNGMLQDSISFVFETNTAGACPNGLDSVWIYIQHGAANISVTPIGPVNICSTDSVQLTAVCNLYNFSGTMDGLQEAIPNNSPATGTFSGIFNSEFNLLSITVNFTGLTAPTLAAHIHSAPPGIAGPVIVSLAPEFPISVTSGTFTKVVALNPADVTAFLTGNTYINIHSVTFPGGEIRGQILPVVDCQGVTYLWSTGETTPSITVSTSASYSVTASGNDGCSDVASVTVDVDPAAFADAGPDQTVCADDTIYLQAAYTGSANGGVWKTTNGGGYGSFWGTETLANAIFVLNSAGMLADSIVFVAETNDPPGVCDLARDTVTVYINGALTLVNIVPSNYNGYGVSCNGDTDGSATAIATGGTEPYIYLWNTGEQTATITGLGSGIYTVTVTGACGDQAISSVLITEPPVLNVTAAAISNFNGFNVSCNKGNDGEAVAVGSGGTGTIDYLWSNGVANDTATGLTAGTHTVTVTDDNGCTMQTTVTLTAPNLLAVDAGPNKTVYRGYPDSSCTTLHAAGTGGILPYSYLWSNGSTADSITVCPTTSRVYYVTITDANGCTGTDSVKVCVIDVRCGNGRRKVTVCHSTGSATNPYQTICIERLDARWHLLNHPGDQLGACGTNLTCPWPGVIRMEELYTDDLPEDSPYLNAFPNPFSGFTMIRFSLPDDDFISLRIIDMTGREIEKLYEGATESGITYEVTFDGNSFNDGIYFLTMVNSIGERMVKKLVLAK